MSTKIKQVIRCVCFFLIVSILFVQVNQIVSHKSIAGEWNTTVKINGFYNEPDEYFDVIGFGSSHMYCAMNPLVLWDSAGIPSYVLATPLQPLSATYHYIKEALKAQKPKVIILDMYMAAAENLTLDEGVYHDAVDYLKPSANKFEMISEMIPKEEQVNYYIPFLAYHSRWEFLDENDFNTEYYRATDFTKGYVYLSEIAPMVLRPPEHVEKKPISDTNKVYLDKLVELSKESDFKLVMIVTPYSLGEEEGVYESIEEYADKNHIDFINFNNLYQELAIDSETDFYDTGHTNCFGSEKVTKYLAEYLTQTHLLDNKYGNETYSELTDNSQEFYLELETLKSSRGD